MVEKKTILIVDDEVQLCSLIVMKLRKAGFNTITANDGTGALRTFEEENIDAVILDYRLPDLTGLDILQEFKQKNESIPVVMLTAYGNIESSVKAMKLGAADYLVKPVELEELKQIVEKVITHDHKSDKPKAESIIFQSPAMQKIMMMVEQVKDTDASILLLGESGVGKTALAKWIHGNTKRQKAPFILVNCAAIPEGLLESELFGYQKGAFTGAAASKIGKFEAANGGTIFLDEIGDISLNMQAKLLHVLEEKQVTPIGSHTPRKIDVRIITATNRDLKTNILEGHFREDLYYRLNLIEIEIPPLRQRKADIPALIQYQIDQLNHKYGKAISIHPDTLNTLCEYKWRGNIRELLNTLERIHILKRSGCIQPNDFIQSAAIPKNEAASVSDKTRNEVALEGNLTDVLEQIEETMIRKALKETNGNQTKAAEKLGIPRHTLLYKLKKRHL